MFSTSEWDTDKYLTPLMLFLHHRRIFSGVSNVSFRDGKLATVCPISSQGLFPCDVEKKLTHQQVESLAYGGKD